MDRTLLGNMYVTSGIEEHGSFRHQFTHYYGEKYAKEYKRAAVTNPNGSTSVRLFDKEKKCFVG